MNPALPVLLAFAVAGPPTTPPAPPLDGLAAPRVVRGALLALPAVYAVEVAPPRRAGGPPGPGGGAPRARSGLAFAVRPDGLLVTALHVVSPDAGPRTRAPVVVVRQLPAAPGDPARAWRAHVVATDADHDLALLRAPLRGAPALVTGPRAGEGTPLALFESAAGAPGAAGAALVRTGTAGPTQLFTQVLERSVTRVRVAVRAGDSGGPAVDGDGRVRGVVVARLDDPREGLVEPPESVDALLAEARETAEEGPTAARFRRAMAELWALRPASARQDLLAVREGFAPHTLAEQELAAAAALERGGFRIVPRGADRGALLATGVASAVAAACFAAALAGLGRRRRA